MSLLGGHDLAHHPERIALAQRGEPLWAQQGFDVPPNAPGLDLLGLGLLGDASLLQIEIAEFRHGEVLALATKIASGVAACRDRA